jgi:hypothetical protein
MNESGNLDVVGNIQPLVISSYVIPYVMDMIIDFASEIVGN